MNGSGRTMSCTVAAFHSISKRYAVASYPHCTSYLDGRFFKLVNLYDGSCGTYFGTCSTFRTTETSLVGHLRLHQGYQIRRWSQYIIGTCLNTQLTSYTALCKIFVAEGTGRFDFVLPLRYFLVFKHGKSSIDNFLLSLYGCSCRKYC